MTTARGGPRELVSLGAGRDVDRVEPPASHRRRLAATSDVPDHRETLALLAGGLAHDLNNLLGVILNCSALVARRVSDVLITADLEEIRAAAGSGTTLTRQLSMLARLAAARPEALDVNDVVVGITSLLEQTVGERIVLHLTLAQVPTMAMADRQQLERALLNLAANAREAMPHGGRLTICVQPSPSDERWPSGAIVTVSDTGIGMATEVVARAFEPFFTTKSGGLGTGLGLTAVQEIVRQVGGMVTLQSEAGVGTVVTLRLPGGNESGRVISSESRTTLSHAPHVLLVDDEPALRTLTARLLADGGLTVVVAGDGVEAIGAVEKTDRPFDIVITDSQMPRMRGEALALRLGVLAPGLPVILMSGSDTGQRFSGRRLPKPVSPTVLLRTIWEVLSE